MTGRQDSGAVDFDALDQHGRVDYLLLRTKLEAELDDQVLERRRLAELTELIPSRVEIQAFEAARWLEPVDSEKAAARLSLVPDQVKKLRERIEQGKKAQAGEHKKTEAKPADKPGNNSNIKPPASESGKGSSAALKLSPALALRAAHAVGSLRESLRTWFTFYDGFTPEFSWWVRKPHEAADKALEEYAKYLREEIAGQHGKDEDPLVGDPIGEEALKRALAAEMIGYSPQQIVAIGQRELSWCEAELRKAAREMGCSEDWKAALAKVKASFVPPGSQDDFVAQQAREATRFVRERMLVTVPPLCEETWRLTMTSPESQKTMPYAAYAGQSMTVAYASEAMKHDDKLMAMRGNNRHFTRIVTAHELIPGHHLERLPVEPLSHVPAALQHTVLRRGLGPLLGAAALGPGLWKDPGRPHRHALLADEPGGTDRRLAPVPPWYHEPRRDGQFPGRAGWQREVRRHWRGAPVSAVFAALPVGLHAGRPATVCFAEGSRRLGPDERVGVSRRHPARPRDARGNGPGRVAQPASRA